MTRLAIIARMLPLLLVCALPAIAQQQAPANQNPNEKPGQLARPNGDTPVDPNQSGQPGTPDTPAKPQEGAGAATPAPTSADWFSPLERNSGTFVMKIEPGGRAETWTNNCGTEGTRFYSCVRLQNREVIDITIFVPGDDPGHYYTQHVLPSGTATGRGDLHIDGNRWIFSSQTTRPSGELNYERLTITFPAKDDGTAKFAGERSDDGEHWMTIYSGTQKRQK